MLTQQDITNLQTLYREELGMEISKEYAMDKGIQLLNVMSQIYKPMTVGEYEYIEKHRQDRKSSLVKRLNEEDELR